MCGSRPAPNAVLVLAVVSTVTVLVTFVFTTLVDEPATAVTLVVILLLSIAIDFIWKRSRERRLVAAPSIDAPDDVGTPGLS